MARESDVKGFGATKLIVPPGGTLAVLVDAWAGECSGVLKYFSGGSLEICGVPPGVTYTGASLGALAGMGYLMGTSESINDTGSARFYLVATGATAIAYCLKGLSAGF
jgi:hypothetical protein